MSVIRFPSSDTTMPDIALRGMTPELHGALKSAADRNHRSLNGEILARLEASVRAFTVEVDVLLTPVNAGAEPTESGKLTEEELRALGDAGHS